MIQIDPGGKFKVSSMIRVDTTGKWGGGGSMIPVVLGSFRSIKPGVYLFIMVPFCCDLGYYRVSQNYLDCILRCAK